MLRDVANSFCVIVCVASIHISIARCAEESKSTEPSSVATSVPLFDGKTFRGWTTVDGRPVTKGWEVVGSAIHLKPSRDRAGHIMTVQQFGNFDLSFEWKIAEGGNSGLKYRVHWHEVPTKGRQPWGCEYQLLDDAKHKNAKNPKTSAGSLYALYEPIDHKPLKPAGEYNQSRIVVRKEHIEHWLNGVKILEANIGSDDWNRRIAKSKFSRVKSFAEEQSGMILLQDHKGEVWFRNLTLRRLDETSKNES